MKSITFIALGLLAVPAVSAHAATAEENWDKNCVQCHGKTGKADTKMGMKLNARDLTDAKVQAGFTDAEAAAAIKDGVQENGKTRMKGFGDKLTPEEITALVAYVRTLK